MDVLDNGVGVILDTVSEGVTVCSDSSIESDDGITVIYDALVLRNYCIAVGVNNRTQVVNRITGALDPRDDGVAVGASHSRITRRSQVYDSITIVLNILNVLDNSI